MRDYVLLLKRDKSYPKPWGTAVVYARSAADAAEFLRSKHPSWDVVRVKEA
jgi:hypothetical protein